LINPIYCDRLQSPLASFSTLDDLNVTAGHSFGHLGPRASPGTISLDLVTNGFINGLLDELSAAESMNYGFFTATADSLASVFDVLSALNDRWAVFPKWARQWTESLAVKPEDFYRRVEVLVLEKLPDNKRGEVAVTLRSIRRELEGLMTR